MLNMKRLMTILLSILLFCAFAIAEEPAQTQWVDLGTGESEMTLVVVFPDQTTRGYHIRSDHETMLEALLQLELAEVTQLESGIVLTSVDGCALPAEQPDAYWFVSVHDPVLDSLVPVTMPLDQLPLAGQTYAFGMINGVIAP